MAHHTQIRRSAASPMGQGEPVMEKLKKQKSFGRSYRPIVIWLDDLREIIATVKDKEREVHISTEEYLFTTIEELPEPLGSQLQFDMKKTSSVPYVRIQFHRQC